jgi:hypothetical protein
MPRKFKHEAFRSRKSKPERFVAVVTLGLLHVWIRFSKFHSTLGEKTLELLVDEGVNGFKGC